MGPDNISDPKIFCTKKFFGPNNWWAQNFFLTKNFLAPKIISDPNFLWPKQMFRRPNYSALFGGYVEESWKFWIFILTGLILPVFKRRQVASILRSVGLSVGRSVCRSVCLSVCLQNEIYVDETHCSKHLNEKCLL